MFDPEGTALILTVLPDTSAVIVASCLDPVKVTPNSWKNTLLTILKLEIQHISAYALTIEKNTQLYHLVKKKKVNELNEKKFLRLYDELISFTKKNNFIQYEISNFCKDNTYSKHNSAYWKKEQYLGFGPSAHSYIGHSRMWNVSNNVKYISKFK